MGVAEDGGARWLGALKATIRGLDFYSRSRGVAAEGIRPTVNSPVYVLKGHQQTTTQAEPVDITVNKEPASRD